MANVLADSLGRTPLDARPTVGDATGGHTLDALGHISEGGVIGVNLRRSAESVYWVPASRIHSSCAKSAPLLINAPLLAMRFLPFPGAIFQNVRFC